MTDYKSMFEQAVRTLAAIDEALGVGDDGCGDPAPLNAVFVRFYRGFAGFLAG